jgi:uncharacterized membrane protein YhaH (DUF805 family)
MGPIEAIKLCFSKYATFSGRASKSEFWWFYLFATLLVLIPVIGGVAWLATIVPFLAVSWRRMHDAGSGGGLILLAFAVQIASIYVFLFSQLSKVNQAMADIDVSEDTTIGEWNRLTSDALDDAAFTDVSFSDVLPALIVFAIGFGWMVYLLARPSDPGPNKFGPNPHEVTP